MAQKIQDTHLIQLDYVKCVFHPKKLASFVSCILANIVAVYAVLLCFSWDPSTQNSCLSVKQCSTKQPPMLQRRGACLTYRSKCHHMFPTSHERFALYKPGRVADLFRFVLNTQVHQLGNHLFSVKCQVASRCTHSTTGPRLPAQSHAFVLFSIRELVYSSTERLIGVVFTCRCRPECIFIQQCHGHAQHPMDIYNGGKITLCKWMLAVWLSHSIERTAIRCTRRPRWLREAHNMWLAFCGSVVLRIPHVRHSSGRVFSLRLVSHTRAMAQFECGEPFEWILRINCILYGR